MSTQQVQIDVPVQLAVRLLDTGDNPVTGVAYSSITVRYQKQGSSWATKTIQSTDWSEGPDGRYLLQFSGSEVDTVGRFVFTVAASGARTFTGDVDVVEDWAEVVDMLEDLLNQLTTKISTDAVKTTKMEQDEAIGNMNSRMATFEDEMTVIESQVAAILKKLA